jgi:four helix bundle protein
MQDPRALTVFDASRQLVRDVYAVASTLPTEERYELSAQIRSAAMSVGSNIAEGCGRSTTRDMCCFLDRALGSANEVQFQVGQALELGIAGERPARRALNTARCVQRMLTSLIRTIRLKHGLD